MSKPSSPKSRPVTRQASEAVSEAKRKKAKEIQTSTGFASQLFAGETGGFGAQQKLGGGQ